MRQKWIITIVAASCASLSAACAHPGARILTAGANEARAAMTPGMAYEDISGVHVFRGKPSERELGPEIRAAYNVDIDVTHRIVWRSIRALRTQGFYSGRGPRSRRYTQGFYSGY